MNEGYGGEEKLRYSHLLYNYVTVTWTADDAAANWQAQLSSDRIDLLGLTKENRRPKGPLYVDVLLEDGTVVSLPVRNASVVPGTLAYTGDPVPLLQPETALEGASTLALASSRLENFRVRLGESSFDIGATKGIRTQVWKAFQCVAAKQGLLGD